MSRVDEGLIEVATELAGELDLDRLLPTVVRIARRMTRARYGALGVLDPDGRHILRFIHDGMDRETVAAIGAFPRGLGLLGKLVREPVTIRTDDIASHPASEGFPPNHPPMTSFLGTPVRAGGRSFGNLYLTDAEGGFTADDESLVRVLAAQAGLAIQTAEMAAQLRLLAVQDERDRISRDLHDGVIQSLFSTGMSLEGVRALVRTDPDRVEQRLDLAVDAIDATIREIRNTIFTLRPGVAGELGLERGLLELAREYEVNAILRPAVQLESSLDPHVPEHLVPDVLHIIREALSNSAKHAEAPSVRLHAVVKGGTLVIEVADAGLGFDLEGITAGDGLGNMAERAAMLGAALTVDSEPGEGTSVRLTVPLEGVQA